MMKTPSERIVLPASSAISKVACDALLNSEKPLEVEVLGTIQLGEWSVGRYLPIGVWPPLSVGIAEKSGECIPVSQSPSELEGFLKIIKPSLRNVTTLAAIFDRYFLPIGSYAIHNDDSNTNARFQRLFAPHLTDGCLVLPVINHWTHLLSRWIVSPTYDIAVELVELDSLSRGLADSGQVMAHDEGFFQVDSMTYGLIAIHDTEMDVSPILVPESFIGRTIQFGLLEVDGLGRLTGSRKRLIFAQQAEDEEYERRARESNA